MLTGPGCWHLLASVAIGRLAVEGRHGVQIVPVDYVVRGEHVFVRSRRSAVGAVTGRALVGFEADGRDGGRRWSVVIRGTGTPIDGDEVDSAGIREPARPAGGGRSWYLRIDPVAITGRRSLPAAGGARSA